MTHRRNLPKFSRPSVEVKGDEPKRAWKWVTAEQLTEGDTITSLGSLSEPPRILEDGHLLMFNVMGDSKDFHPEVLTWAYTAAEPCGELPPDSPDVWDMRCGRPPHKTGGHVAASARWDQ